MKCQEFEENLPLLLYGELSRQDQAACEEHLAACPDCRVAREKMAQFHQVLAQRPRLEPSPALLAESRQALDEALDKEQYGWRALWRHGLPTLRFQPASGFALAMTLLLGGFGLGWMLRPHAGGLISRLPGPAGSTAANSAGVANSELENMRISDISRVAPDPKTGGVKITLDAERRITLEGSLDDPQIRQVLVYIVKSYANPGIRRDTLDALRSRTDNPQIRQALLYAMQHDPNAGVRLEALEAVRNLPFNGDVHTALLEALEHDTNPGVRVAAVDALTDRTEKAGYDLSTVRALEQLANTDRNPYVRLKCANAMVRFASGQ
jgi:hypothetical protein